MRVSRFTVLLLSIIISIFSTGCSFQEIEFGGVKGVSVKNISKESIQLEIKVKITNPNTFSFKITDVDLDVLLNGNELGRINKIEKVTIPAKSDQIHTFNLDIALSKLKSNAISIAASFLTGKKNIILNGTITARWFLIKKKIRIENNQALK